MMNSIIPFFVKKRSSFLRRVFALALEQDLLNEAKASKIKRALISHIEQEATNYSEGFSPTEEEVKRIAEVTKGFLEEGIKARLGGREDVSQAAKIISEVPILHLVEEGRQKQQRSLESWLGRWQRVFDEVNKKARYFSASERFLLGDAHPPGLLEAIKNPYFKTVRFIGLKTNCDDLIEGERRQVIKLEQKISLLDWLSGLSLPGFTKLIERNISSKESVLCRNMIVSIAMYRIPSFVIERDDLTFLREKLMKEGQIIEQTRRVVLRAGKELAHRAPENLRGYFAHLWSSSLKEVESLLAPKRMDWKWLEQNFVFFEKQTKPKPKIRRLRDPRLTDEKITRLKLEFDKASNAERVHILSDPKVDIATAIDLINQIGSVEEAKYILENLKVNRLADIFSADEPKPSLLPDVPDVEDSSEDISLPNEHFLSAFYNLAEEVREKIISAVEARRNIVWV